MHPTSKYCFLGGETLSLLPGFRQKRCHAIMPGIIPGSILFFAPRVIDEGRKSMLRNLTIKGIVLCGNKRINYSFHLNLTLLRYVSNLEVYLNLLS